MNGERQPARPLPHPARVMRHLVKLGGALGLTRSESTALAVFAVGQLHLYACQLAEDDGVTMADVCGWLDSVARAAISPEQHPSHD